MNPRLTIGAPDESIAAAQPNGWMSADTFLIWLKHFIKHTKHTPQNPVLLILDGHSSHKELTVINCARENITEAQEDSTEPPLDELPTDNTSRPAVEEQTPVQASEERNAPSNFTARPHVFESLTTPSNRSSRPADESPKTSFDVDKNKAMPVNILKKLSPLPDAMRRDEPAFSTLLARPPGASLLASAGPSFPGGLEPLSGDAMATV
ncbi:hypothetical protein ANN_14867 [Periplaneta americana]|uniref:DDE-1 domain-containing protein n=1 Tax=Periplaneta americana TaxID=6978 RepID=A0ABQ8SXH1_PERAM|nr:hypothetical protein ANN_14867 [Periplaneta americana]